MDRQVDQKPSRAGAGEGEYESGRGCEYAEQLQQQQPSSWPWLGLLLPWRSARQQANVPLSAARRLRGLLREARPAVLQGAPVVQLLDPDLLKREHL